MLKRGVALYECEFSITLLVVKAIQQFGQDQKNACVAEADEDTPCKQQIMHNA